MGTPTPEIRFVPVQGPGQVYGAEDAWALRSHVRRVVSRKKKERPVLEDIKFVFHQDRQKKRKAKKLLVAKRSVEGLAGSPTPKLISRKSGHTFVDNNIRREATSDLAKPIGKSSKPGTLLDDDGNDTSRSTTPVTGSLTLLHPFVTLFVRHVNMDAARLDFLFKSDAFRLAAEPSFDASHVDSSINMHAVFPECMSEPVFLNALIYAMVQVQERGRLSIESMQLKARTVQLLNKKLTQGIDHVDAALIGAIMILKSVAYKFADYDAYNIHSRGLAVSLESCRGGKVGLTAAAKRANFWLDLFSNVTLFSARQLSHDVLPNPVIWSRTTSPSVDLSNTLPSGFLRHCYLIPDSLLECALDTLELQVSSLSCSPELEEKYTQLDTMQACIESRLAFQGEKCRNWGDLAEAVRLGLFITCYSMFTETWESALIPSMISAQLIEILEKDLCHARDRLALETSISLGLDPALSVWWNCRDLQLWLLLVGASIAELDRGHVDGLRLRYKRALHGFQSLMMSNAGSQSPQTSHTSFHDTKINCMRRESSCIYWRKILEEALSDFIYCTGWRERRLCIPHWYDVESNINSEFASLEEFAGIDNGNCFDTATQRVRGCSDEGLGTHGGLSLLADSLADTLGT